jgi:hypothetical protein
MAASYIPLETVRGLDRGPLVPHVGAYIERARTEGYPPKTVLVHVQLIASLNRYLRRTRRTTRDIDERLITRFIRRDPRAHWSPGPSVTLARLLALLREADATPPAFFVQRLMGQRKVSAHALSSYRDTFRLLLKFAEAELHRRASELALTDLAAPFVGKFLDHLESRRSNVARSRNQRLAAIRSFFRFAAVEAPQHSALIQRVLATPSKRFASGRSDVTAFSVFPGR